MRLRHLLAVIPLAAILITPAPAVAAPPIPSGTFAYFGNVNASQDGTRRCADIDFLAGTYYVELQPCASRSSQRWKLTVQANGMYIIQNAHDGKCMYPEYPATPGQHWFIIVDACLGGSSQDRWQAQPYGGGFQFENNHTGGYLDADRAHSSAGLVSNNSPSETGPGSFWALTSTP